MFLECNMYTQIDQKWTKMVITKSRKINNTEERYLVILTSEMAVSNQEWILTPYCYHSMELSEIWHFSYKTFSINFSVPVWSRIGRKFWRINFGRKLFERAGKALKTLLRCTSWDKTCLQELHAIKTNL